MSEVIQGGATSQSVELFIADSGSTPVGQGKTGLAFNTAGLTVYYRRRGAASVAIVLVTQTVNGAFSSGGFVEIDSAHMPGLYRLDLPDAAVAAGVNDVTVQWKGTGVIDDNLSVDLVNFDPTTVDKTGFSLSATGLALVPGYT